MSTGGGDWVIFGWLFADSDTATLRYFAVICAIGLMPTAYLVERCSASDLAIARGFIRKVSISPDGLTIVAAVENSGEVGDDRTVVRWWNWKGTDGAWQVPYYRVGAFGWTADGSLLVGGWEETRTAVVPWWKLDVGGNVKLACVGHPIDKNIIRGGRIARGVASIAEIEGGHVVTGGIDATLAVWESCVPRWLSSPKTCCFEEQSINVIARGQGFQTSGEGRWRGEESGYSDLPPRQWSPDPWKAVPVNARVSAPWAPWSSSKNQTLEAEGDDCLATINLSGQITVVGAQQWTVSVAADEWVSIATSRDCKTVALASEGRIVKVNSP